jgi:hypothetical protein
VRLQYDRRRGVMLPYCREPEVDFNRGRRSPHYRFQLRIPFARVRAREVLVLYRKRTGANAVGERRGLPRRFAFDTAT